jgi:copper transport protein
MIASVRGAGARTTFVLALLIGLLHATTALAHATLTRSEPAEGAIAAQPPDTIKLIFNEPVAPLVMRLIAPNGEVITPAAAGENSTVTLTLPALREGTHLLSWRVVSADGHPVGGVVSFSVGTVSEPPSAQALSTGDPAVRGVFWATKFVIYVGLLIGIGGVFFHTWVVPRPLRSAAPAWQSRLLSATLVTGLAATVLSVGLQGLDALDLPLSGLTQAAPWSTGLATSYGWTAISAAIALVLGILAGVVAAPALARGLSFVALMGIGLALALSGHATTAEPHALTRPAVFLHAVSVAFWIGALVPLLAAVRAAIKGDRTLARFSRAIPYPLAALLLTGLALAYVQLDRFDALWTTDYGSVLFRKLVFVGVLLALACANRFVLVPRYESRGASAARPLAASFAAEILIAVVILVIVPLWRFTPPPRALAAEPVSIHFHGAHAMTQIDITPARARGAHADLLVLDGEFKPITVKEVTLIFSNPTAGIEPVRKRAQFEGESMWSVEDLRIPLAGVWRLRVDILITDFDKEILEDNVLLPRTP